MLLGCELDIGITPMLSASKCAAVLRVNFISLFCYYSSCGSFPCFWRHVVVPGQETETLSLDVQLFIVSIKCICHPFTGYIYIYISTHNNPSYILVENLLCMRDRCSTTSLLWRISNTMRCFN